MAGISGAEFDQVFLRWYCPVRNSVYYKAGDMQEAEDIAQETFLKVWEKRGTVNIQTIGPLLYKISGNIFLNRVEHKKVELKFLTDYNEEHFSDSPDFLLEIRDFDQQLQAAIAELDEKSRTVFLMNRIDDMTYSQIAQYLGLSVKAIEKRMSRALAFLKGKINVEI